MSIFVVLKCCLQRYGRLKRTVPGEEEGDSRVTECVFFICASFKPLSSLKFFPSCLSSYCSWCWRGRGVFLQRCHDAHTRLGGLSQSQLAFLPQSQIIVCPLAHPILGRKCKKRQGGITSHYSEWHIKGNETGNGFSFFPPFVLYSEIIPQFTVISSLSDSHSDPWSMQMEGCRFFWSLRSLSLLCAKWGVRSPAELGCSSLMWLQTCTCTHTQRSPSQGECSVVGLWRDFIFILPGTDGNTRQNTCLCLCFAVSFQKAMFRILHLFFLFKCPLITCYM